MKLVQNDVQKLCNQINCLGSQYEYKRITVYSTATPPIVAFPAVPDGYRLRSLCWYINHLTTYLAETENLIIAWMKDLLARGNDSFTTTQTNDLPGLRNDNCEWVSSNVNHSPTQQQGAGEILHVLSQLIFFCKSTWKLYLLLYLSRRHTRSDRFYSIYK